MSDQHTDDTLDRALDAWTPMDPPANFVDRVVAARVSLAPRVTSKRAWWLAAPIAAVAMIAIVVFVSSTAMKSDRAAESPSAVSSNGARTEQAAGSGSDMTAVGSGAGVAMNQPVSADAGVAAQPPGTFDVPDEDPPSIAVITIRAGDSATIHDPELATKIDLDFAGTCPDGGAVELARGPTKVVVYGRARAAATLDEGSYHYQLRCRTGPPVAEGRIDVIRDDARRPLPTQATDDPTAPQIVITSFKDAASSGGHGVIVRGIAAPGATLELAGAPIRLDARRRFTFEIGFVRTAVRVRHPKHGDHYYVMPLFTR